MHIDRSNYEIWLIDWLDGNLNHQQVEELKLFLNANPDLNVEFDELAAINLKPSVNIFPNKNQLKKSTDDLSKSQFEYLCVACLENDISAEQRIELLEIINKDSEKKRIFELIQKTRLSPIDINYKLKKYLLKRTVQQNIIRFSAIGLSAAATIALIIITFLTIPRSLPENINNMATNTLVDSIIQQPSVNQVPDKIITGNVPNLIINKRDKLLSAEQNINSVLPISDTAVSIPDDTLIRNPENPKIAFQKIPVNTEIILKDVTINNILIASNSFYITPEYDDERSNISRFIAKTFRERILKNNTSPESPLKGYEIAEAGVAGLNKLLGWQMALDMNNDENGELRSIYFSSKILKFNAPVKKSELLP